MKKLLARVLYKLLPQETIDYIEILNYAQGMDTFAETIEKVRNDR